METATLARSPRFLIPGSPSLSPAARNPSLCAPWRQTVGFGERAAGPMKVCSTDTLAIACRNLVDDLLGKDCDQFDLFTSETVEWHNKAGGGREAHARHKTVLHIGEASFMAEGDSPEAVFEQFETVTLPEAVGYYAGQR